ncbi:MAG: histidine kinase [Phormidesmis sp. CAN_BIN36]|nr:histidine kinase [Phormidesmis sp. CAN_BIN36]
MPTPCHIIVEGNPAIVYASRGGTPNKVLPTLERFLDKFWQERDLSGEHNDTPECLLAQIVVRFGYEICEDDFSNLKVGVNYDPTAEYLYLIASDRSVIVWAAGEAYHQDPTLGLQACQPSISTEWAPKPSVSK